MRRGHTFSSHAHHNLINTLDITYTKFLGGRVTCPFQRASGQFNCYYATKLNMEERKSHVISFAVLFPLNLRNGGSTTVMLFNGSSPYIEDELL